ncbi:hypothetical protein HAX54_039698 [Datura stramonium]|uniref:NB-ARC domain-containing protein n=1 Tax=Datura stramonium TaxID=4076 RepID=A0ABS8VQB7_DATST|nr:hypothetical protein [Datura stramonium]
MSHFDIRAKTTVSQEYCTGNVLLGLLSSITGMTNILYELTDRLQKISKGRRYLIVTDDIWTTTAWDDFKLFFPDYHNESHILLTTRNMEVTEYGISRTPPYQTQLLWKDLNIVGKLPKLEVLKLAYDACEGEEWEVVEEGFAHLKLLLLKCINFR